MPETAYANVPNDELLGLHDATGAALEARGLLSELPY